MSILSVKSLIANIIRALKGPLRDPLSYVGVISAILLIFVSFLGGDLGRPRSVVFSDNKVQGATAGTGELNKTFIEQNNFQLKSPDLNLIQNNTVLAFTLPSMVTPQVLGTILGETAPSANKNIIIEYEVMPGDSLSKIAEKFGISTDTLLLANNLNRGSTIKVGQTLVILPVSGLLHYVKAGDTISEISLKYKVESQEIINFNELASQDDIFIGDILVVPGGKMPVIKNQAPSQTLVPLASSYFICPIASPCRSTQGLHFSNAVDFSHGKCGDFLYAAAGGQVLRVKYGWNGGAGSTITILHPNGVVTSYGHILSALVSPGDQVYQGQIIATMGGQPGTPGAGISTGCHVHFSVQGARNPFAR